MMRDYSVWLGLDPAIGLLRLVFNTSALRHQQFGELGQINWLRFFDCLSDRAGKTMAAIL